MEIASTSDNQGPPSHLPGRVVLPKGFTNSPRLLRALIDDGLAVVSHLGKPNLFITITTNTNWPEFQRERIRARQRGHTHYNPTEDPVFVTRVFHARFFKILAWLKSYKVIGKTIYLMWGVDFQKRGLPHAHIAMKTVRDVTLPAAVDDVVSTELPPESDPEPRARVLEFIMHTCTKDR